MINREDIVSEIYDFYHNEDKKTSKKSTSLKESKKKIITKKVKPLNESKNSLKEGIKDDFDFLDKMAKAVGKDIKEDKKSLKENILKTTEDYIDEALERKGISFEYNYDDEKGQCVYQFKDENDLQQADMIICNIVGDKYELDKKDLKIWLTDSLEESKLIKEDLSFLEKELGPNWRDIELKDDDSLEGGVSYEGETLGHFIDEVGTEDIKSLEDLNSALRECGIQPVEKSLEESFSLEEELKQTEDKIYESYLEGMKRYFNDDNLAKSYASCKHNFDISRLNELVSKKNGEKND